jgi:hypothetical protein
MHEACLPDFPLPEPGAALIRPRLPFFLLGQNDTPQGCKASRMGNLPLRINAAAYREAV